MTKPGQYEKQVYTLPKHLDEKVASLHLGKIGAKLTKMTPEQSKYLGVPQAGPFKAERTGTETFRATWPSRERRRPLCNRAAAPVTSPPSSWREGGVITALHPKPQSLRGKCPA